MRLPVPSERTVWRVAVLLYAVLLTSLHMAMTAPWRLASFDKLVAFEAAEPFQHRLLIPALVAGAQSILPLGERLLFALCEIAGWVALILLARRTLATLRIGRTEYSRRVLAFTLTIPMALHLIVPDLVLTPLLSLQEGRLELGTWRAQALFYYAYDLPAAAFTLALVLFMLELVRTRDTRWLALYLAVFAVATVNRETTLFLIPVFAAVFYGILDRMMLAKALALQVAIFVAIQGVLQWTFADNINPNAGIPGTQYENHLLANLWLLINPLYFLTFMTRFGAGFYLPALLLRPHLDPTLGRILLWFGVPFLASVLLLGRIQEQRVVIELVPLLWLGGLQAVAAWRALPDAAAVASRPRSDARRAAPPRGSPVAGTSAGRAPDVPGHIARHRVPR